MKPIRDEVLVKHYGQLIKEMMLTEKDQECEFDPIWVRHHGWNVVPVESAMHIAEEDIFRIVTVLNSARYTQCVAVFNEAGYIENLPAIVSSDPPDDMPTSYFLSIDEKGFREFNKELGPFRVILTPNDRSWAISCNEFYNLFAGNPDLLQALLGKTIPEARREFIEFARLLAEGNPSYPLLKIAEGYASL